MRWVRGISTALDADVPERGDTREGKGITQALRRILSMEPSRVMAGILVLAFVSTLPSVWAGFATDDHYFRAVFGGAGGLGELGATPYDIFVLADGDANHNRVRMNRGYLPWWTPADSVFMFWRPVASFSHYVDFRLFGERAWLMHLHSMALYLLVVYAVARFYRQKMGASWMTPLAALLFALDDAHGVTVGWLANRNALYAILFGILAVRFHEGWRRDGNRSGLALALALMAATLLSSEGGMAMLGYIVAYEVCLHRGPWLNRFAALIPYGVLVAGWRIVYKFLGYGVTSSGLYVDPVADPLRFVTQSLQQYPLLFLGQFGISGPGISMVFPSWLALAFWGLAIAFLVALAYVLWPLLRRDATARYWAVGMLVSAIPLCATMAQARLLLFPGIGAMGLLAQFIAGRVDGECWGNVSPTWNKGARVAFIVLVGFNLVLSPPLKLVNSYAIAFYDEEIQRFNAELAAQPKIREKTLVIVNSLGDINGVILPFAQAANGEPAPRRQWMLYAGISSIDMSRPNDRTLVLAPERGFLTKPWAQMFRCPKTSPMRAGDEVLLDGLHIRVVKVDRIGQPMEVEFTFEKRLEDPEYVWITLSRGLFESFTPPPVGERMTLKILSPLEMAVARFGGESSS